ncbi:MAG TPA: hypothetical protein VFH53_02610, partial [Phycisphaerae bacterium]|nr:hypothetical protein [Phycisphaerae bacterium]
MRDFPAENDLRASAGSYAHKGMHMTWMPKARNCRKKPPKPAKNLPKTCKKLQIRASPSYQKHPVRRKIPPDATAKADGQSQIAQKYPPKLAPKSYPQSPTSVSSGVKFTACET